MYRLAGLEEAYSSLARMSLNTIIDLDDNIAVLAGEYSIEHRLALADSVIYATSRAYNCTLWTQDSDFADLEGVRYAPHRGH